MKSESSKCQVILLAPTREQGMALIDTWKKAESQCEGACCDHKIHVAGADVKTLNLDLECTKTKRVFCLTAESQEDWEKVKSDWIKNFKDKCKGTCVCIVAANKEEKSKKWCEDVKADCWVDLSSCEQCITKMRKELVSKFDMKIKAEKI